MPSALARPGVDSDSAGHWACSTLHCRNTAKVYSQEMHCFYFSWKLWFLWKHWTAKSSLYFIFVLKKKKKMLLCIYTNAQPQQRKFQDTTEWLNRFILCKVSALRVSYLGSLKKHTHACTDLDRDPKINTPWRISYQISKWVRYCEQTCRKVFLHIASYVPCVV